MKLREADAQSEAKLQRAYDVLDRAVADHAFPGGVLAVGYQDELIVHAFGRQTYDAKSPAVNADTIYDAASLTKPVVTTTLVAMQVEAGRIGLDLPVARYIPEWNDGPNPDWRKTVTVRNLLTHSSGLPAHKDYFLTLHSKREFIAAICKEPLEYAPGTKTVYSDLGFILLGEILERATGKTVDQLAHEQIFAPLDMAEHDVQSAEGASEPHRAQRKMTRRFARRSCKAPCMTKTRSPWAASPGTPACSRRRSDLAAFCQMLAERRNLRPPPPADSRDDCAIHRAAGDRGQRSHAWMDDADA